MLVLFVSGAVWAQAGQHSVLMAFERLGVRNGLSQNTVLDLMQDSQGFIWVATENGLNRYDGQGFRVYFREPHADGGLLSDYIWDIQEDSRGNLWLATDDAGVLRWDRSSDSFSAYPGQRGVGDRKSHSRTQALHIAADGSVWVGSVGGGVYVLSPEGKKIAEYGFVPGVQKGLISNSIVAIAQSPKGDIWLGTQAGLQRISSETGEVLSIDATTDDVAVLAGDSVSSLLFDRQGNLWVGTYAHGAYVLSEGDPTKPLRRYYVGSTHERAVTHNYIRDILEDSTGNIWLATQRGVVLIDPRGDVIAQSVHDPANSLSVANDDVMALYEDRGGVIWVGTRGGGISRWNPRSLALGPRKPSWLSGTHVMAFAETPSGEVLMATKGQGIVRLDPQGRKLGFLDGLSGYADIPDMQVMSLLKDRRGNIWIGTFANSLFCWEFETGELHHYPAVEGATDAIGAPGIMSIEEDEAGLIWVGTFAGGVAFVNPLTKEVSRVGDNDTQPELFNARATAIATAPNNEIWIGTDGSGLFRLNQARGTIEHFNSDRALEGGLPSNNIYALHVDAAGDLWVGTSGYGLVHLDRRGLVKQAPTFESTTVADGLPSNVVYGIEPDASGNFWLSSNSGLTRFDPRTKQMRLFHTDHGLFGEEFNLGAHYSASNGKIYFGGAGGFNIVDPVAARSDGSISNVLLTSITTIGAEPLQNSPAYLLDEVTLPHDVDAISLEYAVMDFVAPSTNQFSIRMVGFDREWSEPTKRSRSTYTNLDAGNYVFQVRGANSDGVWSESPYELRISVLPAPWATWWAYSIYAALFGGALWLFLHLRFREQERRARLNQLVYYDVVTGMPNRDLFAQRMHEGYRRATEKDQGFAVLSVKVQIPQSLVAALGRQGHDDVLRAISSSLARVVHAESSARARRDLARVDADEFAVSIRSLRVAETSERLAVQIIETMSEPLVLSGQSVPLTVAIGIAVAPDHSNDPATLLKYASAASSELAGDREGGVVYFDHDVTRRAADKLSLESRLREAIRSDGLDLHFQPIYRVADNVIVGAEALVRWNDGSRGWVSPSEFVALAEESRLIIELDTWVVRRACDRLAAWQREGRPATRVSINVSAANVQRAELVTTFADYCQQVGVNPASIQIEITESALLRDSTDVRQSLATLNEYGFGVALDDFGTGYSSLSHMKMLDISAVKIDRSFVEGIATDIDSLTICRAIIGLARGLDLKTVAEGVETTAQYEALAALGCDEMQGYLRSPAVPEEAFLALLGPATADPETEVVTSHRVVGPWKDSQPG